MTFTEMLGQGGGDCRQAFEGGRNLDHGVRTVHLGPEFLGLLLGGLGLVSQTRIHFDGDAAVNEIGLLGNLTEDVGGVAHVGGGELAHGGLNVDLAQFLQLRIVRADLVQSLLEDGRLVVTPTTFLLAMRSCREPDSMRERDRSSSQIETPESEVR